MRSIVLAALTLSSLGAQPYPSGETLVRRSETAARKLHSLQFHDRTITVTKFQDLDPSLTDRSDFSSATVYPDKTRIELKGQDGTLVAVADGASTWVYSSDWREYTRLGAVSGPEGIMALLAMEDMMPNFGDTPTHSNTIGEETITIDGRPYECWVVETHVDSMDLPGQGKAKATEIVHVHWFDKKLGLDLQSSFVMKVVTPGGPMFEMRARTVRQTMRIDEPIADSTFVFTPPEGVKEVDKLSMFGGRRNALPDLAGKTAPPVTGAPQGKPVLLNFSTGWCRPCRQSQPALDRISADYQDRGLVVVAVNADGESTADVLDRYAVVLYPSFVLIGRDGKVVASEIGFSGEARLRAMLAKELQ